MKKIILSLFFGLFLLYGTKAQNCLGQNTISITPLENVFECGETATICLTVDTWNTTNANWIHGIVANFGPGWDLSTLVPGPPPTTIGFTTGTWGWYNTCTSTSGVGLPPQGPGFFFDLDNDGDPGNNFGDFATVGPWEFCWTISVLSGNDCINGADLTITFDIFGDSETGSWGGPGCNTDPMPFYNAQVLDCPYAGIGTSLTLCSTNDPVDLFPLLTDSPDIGGTWTDPNGNTFNGVMDPSVHSSGAYTYTIAADGNCEASSSISSITINNQPEPGIETEITMCSTDPPYDLVINLSFNDPPLDPNGIWTDPIGNTIDGIFYPATSMNGQYSYTVLGLAPCVNTTTLVYAYSYSLSESEAYFFYEPNEPVTTESTIVTFTALENQETYSWAINDQYLYGQSIVFEFPDEQAAQYMVCLTVSDTLECEATHCEPFTVHEAFSQHIPNTFTPDGDGINDTFVPIILGEDNSVTEFRIFDRWGELVYETEGEITPWNGCKNNEGPKLSQGLYTWTLLVKHAFTPERNQSTGHVVLLY